MSKDDLSVYKNESMSILKEIKKDIEENTKLNPAFLVLPKLLGDLGPSPGELLVTRRSKARAEVDEKATTTIADLMSNIGAIMRKREPKPIDVKQLDIELPESLDNQGIPEGGNAA